jgi:N-acetylmuramoyl-L-alanine amidase
MKLTTFLIATLMSISINNSLVLADECDSVETLALNMYHEARGEGIDGMIMVAEVTLNRVDHPRYPNDVCRVVYQRRQFSWTHTIRNHTPREDETWDIVLNLSESILLGEIETFGTGATHFYNPDLVRNPPRWTRSFQEVGRVGNHVFYSY